MNSIKSITIVAIIACITFSFASFDAQKKDIKTTESKVVWKGYKVSGSHQGTISITSGHLEFDAEKLIGGALVLNMKSISTTDMNAEYNAKLDGHLKSEDFFAVETFPSASIKFTSVKASGKNAYEVTGDITIKDQTHSETFTLSVYGNKASAALKLDRAKYNVKYGSTSFFKDLKDKVIYDEFDLIADLEF